jgi:hypothetical protein
MSDLSVCDTKVLYDTEFEAEIAARKYEHRYDTDMRHYRCGTHWHIAHVKKYERRGTGHRYRKCYKCGLIMKNEVFLENKHVCSKEKRPLGNGETA